MTGLRWVMRANALSCFVFGALFAELPDMIREFLGSTPEAAIMVLGWILLANAVHLLYASTRKQLLPGEVIWFAIGDLMWWLLSAALLAAKIWITRDAAIVVTWVVATGVAGIGLTQLWLLGRATANVNSATYWRQIGQSWLALPLWVKAWLFYLNATFLAVLFFTSPNLVHIVLIAYFSTGPLLFAFAFVMGGFSRIMGVGHLVPWIPLLWWLYQTYWNTGIASTEAVYASLLSMTVIICLCFDIYDVIRWFSGDRSIIRSKQSVALA